MPVSALVPCYVLIVLVLLVRWTIFSTARITAPNPPEDEMANILIIMYTVLSIIRCSKRMFSQKKKCNWKLYNSWQIFHYFLCYTQHVFFGNVGLLNWFECFGVTDGFLHACLFIICWVHLGKKENPGYFYPVNYPYVYISARHGCFCI